MTSCSARAPPSGRLKNVPNLLWTNESEKVSSNHSKIGVVDDFDPFNKRVKFETDDIIRSEVTRISSFFVLFFKGCQIVLVNRTALKCL